jgi:hypothetical protein
MSKQNTSTSNGFQVTLEAAKDYLAHKKFTKASNLCYRGEMRRLDLPKGPYGWIQWRMQFTPRQGEDMSPVENELNRLHDQRKLNDDEYARLRSLYGLDGQVTAQVPPSILRQPPFLSGGFCVNCGAQIKLGKRFCQKCGAPLTSTTQTGNQPTAPTCPNCGSRVPAGKKFCTSCGTRLVAN